MLTLYLTFDDGPQLPGTINCINILNELNLPATFFVIGNHLLLKKNKDVVENILSYADRFLIANHSLTHAQEMTYTNYYAINEYAAKDIISCQSKVAFPTKIVRLPGNSAWVNHKEMFSRNQVKDTCIYLKEKGIQLLGGI